MYKYSRTPCFAVRKPVPKDAHAYYFHLIIKNVRTTHTHVLHNLLYIDINYTELCIIYILCLCRKHWLQ